MTRILVIEDVPELLAEIAEWLNFEGYDVVTAVNGRDGVEKAMTAQPDLIVSDITMPEMDGYEVLEALQKEPHLASVPFIFLTAHADKSAVRRGMNLGADDYITKPFKLDELLTAIETRLKRRQTIADTAHQDVSELKRKLVAMVSHELNTPLVSLSFVQELIEEQLGRLSREETAELLETLRAGTNRLEHLVRQTVILSKIEAKTLTAETIRMVGRPVLLWQLIADAMEMARRYAYRNQQGHIAIDQQDEAIAIFGDVHLLKQAISELLTNALNFSPQGASIHLHVWQADAWVWLRVQDAGSGMNAADSTKAQQPFEQIDRERREQQGMGLGLSVSRHIVELHGGRFEIISIENRGTQVTFSLPLAHSGKLT